MGICWMSQGTQIGGLYQPRGVRWGGRGEGGSRGRDKCTPMTDSCWCFTVENNKIL